MALHKKSISKKKFKFFLNPYDDLAFTRCPKCNRKTAIRKIALLIHIEPQDLFILNKQCKFCAACELIIAKKCEIESMMAHKFETVKPEIVGNDYWVMGVIDKGDWNLVKNKQINAKDLLDSAYIFKDVLNFEIVPGGWLPPQVTK